MDQQKFCVGQYVRVNETSQGFIKYIGETHFAKGIYVGIEFNEPIGNNNGSMDGVRYFVCKDSFGKFVSLGEIEHIYDNINLPNKLDEAIYIDKPCNFENNENNINLINKDSSAPYVDVSFGFLSPGQMDTSFPLVDKDPNDSEDTISIFKRWDVDVSKAHPKSIFGTTANVNQPIPSLNTTSKVDIKEKDLLRNYPVSYNKDVSPKKIDVVFKEFEEDVSTPTKKGPATDIYKHKTSTPCSKNSSLNIALDIEASAIKAPSDTIFRKFKVEPQILNYSDHSAEKDKIIDEVISNPININNLTAELVNKVDSLGLINDTSNSSLIFLENKNANHNSIQVDEFLGKQNNYFRENNVCNFISKETQALLDSANNFKQSPNNILDLTYENEEAYVDSSPNLLNFTYEKLDEPINKTFDTLPMNKTTNMEFNEKYEINSTFEVSENLNSTVEIKGSEALNMTYGPQDASFAMNEKLSPIMETSFDSPVSSMTQLNETIIKMSYREDINCHDKTFDLNTTVTLDQMIPVGETTFTIEDDELNSTFTTTNKAANLSKLNITVHGEQYVKPSKKLLGSSIYLKDSLKKTDIQGRNFSPKSFIKDKKSSPKLTVKPNYNIPGLVGQKFISSPKKNLPSLQKRVPEKLTPKFLKPSIENKNIKLPIANKSFSQSLSKTSESSKIGKTKPPIPSRTSISSASMPLSLSSVGKPLLSKSSLEGAKTISKPGIAKQIKPIGETNEVNPSPKSLPKTFGGQKLQMPMLSRKSFVNQVKEPVKQSKFQLSKAKPKTETLSKSSFSHNVSQDSNNSNVSRKPLNFVPKKSLNMAPNQPGLGGIPRPSAVPKLSLLPKPKSSSAELSSTKEPSNTDKSASRQPETRSIRRPTFKKK